LHHEREKFLMKQGLEEKEEKKKANPIESGRRETRLRGRTSP